MQTDPTPIAKSVEEPVVNKLNDGTSPAPKTANHTLASSKLSPLKNLISPNTVLSVFGLGADTAIRLMTGVENFLNARSNIDEVDSVMSMFNKLFLSRGSNAMLTYYTLFANFWVNFDAVAQFVRGIENRIVVRRAEIQAEIAEEEASEIVEETLLSLTAANAQLEDFKNNLENLIRRQGIARTGAVTRNKDAVEPQSELSGHEEDDDSDEEHDEEEDEPDLTRNVNSLAEEISSGDQTVMDGTLVQEYVDEETNDIDPSADMEEEEN